MNRLLAWFLVALIFAMSGPLQAATMASARGFEKSLYGRSAPWADKYAYCSGDPINHSDPSGLDFKLLGSKKAATDALYQLEKYSGLQLSLDGNRRVKIDGGSYSSSAAQFLFLLVNADTVTRVRALDDNQQTGYFPGTGSYFTADGIQAIKPSRLADLARADSGVAAGQLFHEIGEAFSRESAGDTGATQGHNDAAARQRYDVHHAFANQVQGFVQRDYGLTTASENQWMFMQSGSLFQIRAGVGAKFNAGNHWHVDFSRHNYR